jgi:hypothetical protein
MEVLACIPELPCLDAVVATPAPEPLRLSVLPAPSIVLSEPAIRPEAVSDVSPSPAPRCAAARRSPPARFFSPSIITLVAMAAVVWAAAWRNDRLRLDAAREQRPERLAQELLPTAGAARSVTP